MNPDVIFHSEMRLLAVELVSLCVWVIFSRFPIRLVTTLLVSTLIVVGSLRPAYYNSDTRNYASYVAQLSIEKGANLYFLTKLEPLHIFLIDITRDFEAWLLAEGAFALAIVWVLYSRVKRPEPLLLIYAFFVTLYTSSLRFAIALLVFGVLLTWIKRSPVYLAAISLLGGCVHAMMLVAGPFASRLKWMPLAFPGAFFLLAMLSTETRNRVASDLSDVKSIGLKSFATFLVACAYASYKSSKYRSERAIWDLIGFSAIFVVTALFFPGLNRMIILGTLLVAMEIDRNRISLREDKMVDRIATLVMFFMITAPYLYLTPRLYYYNTW